MSPKLDYSGGSQATELMNSVSISHTMLEYTNCADLNHKLEDYSQE